MYLKNDITSEINKFNNPQVGWSAASQEEIDAYLLSQAVNNKIDVLIFDFNAFLDVGFLYNEDTFLLTDCGVNNILLKSGCPSGMPDRYKYFDIDNVQIDFVNNDGFTAFKDAIFSEKDRIMTKYNDYKKEIDDCLTVAEVDAITIDFSE